MRTNNVYCYNKYVKLITIKYNYSYNSIVNASLDYDKSNLIYCLYNRASGTGYRIVTTAVC